MGVQIGAKPDSGFDDPIGMLKDCHRRIEHFLNVLGVVLHRAQGRRLTEEENMAVGAALNYFREGGRRHTADEEQSLFPRLRAECEEADFSEIGGLEHDHGEANETHMVVEDLYSRWMREGELSSEYERRLGLAMQRLEELYREHIALEDNVLFPRAVKSLSQAAIAEIGREFRARRS